MFTGISFGAAIVVLVLIYMFRANIKQLNEQLPEAVSNLTTAAVRATKALDTTVTVNCIEHGAELTARINAAMADIQEMGGIANFDELYNQVYNIKPKKQNHVATTAVNP